MDKLERAAFDFINEGYKDLEYKFEPIHDGRYQVRLCGEFVCYSNYKDEKRIDQVLKEAGWDSREEFLKAGLE